MLLVSGTFRLSFGTSKPPGSEVGYEFRIENSRASREPVRICADGLARRSTPGFLLFRDLLKKKASERPARSGDGPAEPDTKFFDN